MTNQKTNPVVYFEIPVNDMRRAITFYQTVFGFTFEQEELDGYDMAFFPLNDNQPGITGALAKGDVYQPSHQGAILYFYTEDIDSALENASRLGSQILYPKTINTDHGFAVAEIEDSEGNRIALRQTI
ncbi:VOC family protein [Sphingobacterium sp. LRF_L2]|uniref:VOC family protein n=1 Tax=Sphingobacterium sp. LRF_L2 TaxID=3369421 RepID=UPI003F632560